MSNRLTLWAWVTLGSVMLSLATACAGTPTPTETALPETEVVTEERPTMEATIPLVEEAEVQLPEWFEEEDVQKNVEAEKTRFREYVQSSDEFAAEPGEESGLVWKYYWDDETKQVKLAVEVKPGYGHPQGTILVYLGEEQGFVVLGDLPEGTTVNYDFELDRLVCFDTAGQPAWLLADNGYLVPNPQLLDRFADWDPAAREVLREYAEEGVNLAAEEVQPLTVKTEDEDGVRVVGVVDPRADSAVGQGIWEFSSVGGGETDELDLALWAPLPSPFNPETHQVQASYSYEDGETSLTVVNLETGDPELTFDPQTEFWQEAAPPTDTPEPTTEPTEEPTEQPPTAEPTATPETQTEFPPREEYIPAEFDLRPTIRPDILEGEVGGIHGVLYQGGYWGEDGVAHAADGSWNVVPPSGRYRIALARNSLFRERIFEGDVAGLLSSWDLLPRGEGGSGYLGVRIHDQPITLSGNSDLAGEVIIGDIMIAVD